MERWCSKNWSISIGSSNRTLSCCSRLRRHSYWFWRRFRRRYRQYWYSCNDKHGKLDCIIFVITNTHFIIQYHFFIIILKGGTKHKLQFLIGDHVLPYTMTVYQAIRQYSPLVNDQSETDTDTETPIGIFFRSNFVSKYIKKHISTFYFIYPK